MFSEQVYEKLFKFFIFFTLCSFPVIKHNTKTKKKTSIITSFGCFYIQYYIDFTDFTIGR